MNIYCNHDWYKGMFGSYSDCWRKCDRCGTKWWPIKESKDKSGWTRFIFGSSIHGIYGKEPRIVIGKVGK